MIVRNGILRGALLGLLATVPALAGDDALYRALREAGVADARVVENLVLRRDNGTITLKSGSIGFTAPAEGRDTVAVFAGEGTFVFDPATPIEKSHLQSLTGQERVEETFDRVLLCFTDRTAEEIRRDAKSPVPKEKLDGLLKDFRKHLRAESSKNIEAELLADLYHPEQPGFFSAYFHGHKREDLRFFVKPRGVLPELPAPEEVAILDADATSEQRGIWYLAHEKSEIQQGKASSDENKRVVEAESYRVETTIAKNDRFTASATVRFHVVNEGDRVIHFGLLPTLRVTKVLSGGADVPFIQEDRRRDGDFYAVMPKPMTPGTSYELAIEYSGDKVVHKAGGGNFSVGAREDWYPSVNTFRDHAKYDLTFRVPKEYTLVSVGNLDKQWTEQGMACSHWVSDVPVAIAGFNYGSFKKSAVKDADTGVTVEGYAASAVPDYLAGAEGMDAMGGMSPSRLMAGTIVEAQNSMRLFAAWFGKPEFNRIAITQQPEFSFGQSWPTLVYLPMSAYLDDTQRWQLMGRIESGLTEFVNEVTPHEVSHQWWGHEVGWTTYHDQWLSEGFAFFSAGLYLQATGKTPEKYIAYWEHARQMLMEKNQFGRRTNDAGPVWMGLRLGSAKNRGVYDAVVYRKGGYVLNMLRTIMYDAHEHDKPFMAMMQDFVEQHRNRNATTESFERVVEQHMRPSMNAGANGKMDWFFQQWVYGTAVPRYKFDYTVTADAEGKWILKASLTQSEVPADFVGIVPLYADFDGTVARLGLVHVVGSSTVGNILLKLPKKPRKVAIDMFHDVLEQ